MVNRAMIRGAAIGVVACWSAVAAAACSAAEPYEPKLPMQIPVLAIKYFPVKDDRIDRQVTGDWGAPLKETREKTERITEELIAALEEGSRYHGYNNYQRGTSEACENHLHQIEAVLNWVDGRDRTPPQQWDTLLFWGKFVGSDRSQKIVRPGCGWSHYPPNAQGDYDWANKRYVQTDIEDWRPDGTGKKQRMNCDRWRGESLKWFVYWMQSLPGAQSGLTHQGKPRTNWWIFLGDFDNAVRRQMGRTRK